MGWLWNSPNNSSTSTTSILESNQSDQSDPPQFSSQDNAPKETTSPFSSQDAPSSEPTPTLTREEAADAELRAFLTSLEESRSPQTSPKNSSSPTLHQQTPNATLITPIDVHATTVSCRAAFDSAFYCASLGGQFTSLYRYGQLRQCSQEWSDFWWCMRTNRGFMSDEERAKKVLERGVRREREKYGGEGRGSSEDVWERRRRKVQGAFDGDWEALQRQEGEWEGR